MILAAVAGLLMQAQAQSRDERAVRVAYVYNLIQYVEWPSPGKDVTIAIAGNASTGDVMAQLLDGKSSNGQTIHVVRAGKNEDLQRYRIAYIADAPEGDVRRLLEKARGRDVLTLGETEEFVRAGGMVALVNTGDHIRLEVNLEAVQAAGIRISSRVLDLATIVRPSGKGGA